MILDFLESEFKQKSLSAITEAIEEISPITNWLDATIKEPYGEKRFRTIRIKGSLISIEQTGNSDIRLNYFSQVKIDNELYSILDEIYLYKNMGKFQCFGILAYLRQVGYLEEEEEDNFRRMYTFFYKGIPIAKVERRDTYTEFGYSIPQNYSFYLIESI